MRVVNVSLSESKGRTKVVCDKERMYIRPSYFEEFLIRFDDTVPQGYTLEVELEDGSFLKPGDDSVRAEDRANVVYKMGGRGRELRLLDECHTRGIAKFSIRLFDEDGEVDVLDPHVVND